MTTELYLVRHGWTDWNHEGRWQGRLALPLNDSEHSQAKDMRIWKALAEISGQHRSHRTAVFTHRSAIALVRCRARGWPRDHFWNLLPKKVAGFCGST